MLSKPEVPAQGAGATNSGAGAAASIRTTPSSTFEAFGAFTDGRTARSIAVRGPSAGAYDPPALRIVIGITASINGLQAFPLGRPIAPRSPITSEVS